MAIDWGLPYSQNSLRSSDTVKWFVYFSGLLDPILSAKFNKLASRTAPRWLQGEKTQPFWTRDFVTFGSHHQMLVGLGVPIHDDFDQKNGIGRWVCSWNQVFLGSILNFILCPTIVVTSLNSGQWGWTGWQNTAGSMASPDTSPSPFFRGRAVWAPCACLNRPSKHLIKSLCSIQWLVLAPQWSRWSHISIYGKWTPYISIFQHPMIPNDLT